MKPVRQERASMDVPAPQRPVVGGLAVKSWGRRKRPAAENIQGLANPPPVQGREKGGKEVVSYSNLVRKQVW